MKTVVGKLFAALLWGVAQGVRQGAVQGHLSLEFLPMWALRGASCSYP
jgi:hypothetical protein